jgi:hypothetical protein
VDGRGRVEDWNRNLRDNAGNDGGFALSASVDEHGEYDSLEKGRRLVKSFLQCVVQVHVESEKKSVNDRKFRLEDQIEVLAARYQNL